MFIKGKGSGLLLHEKFSLGRIFTISGSRGDLTHFRVIQYFNVEKVASQKYVIHNNTSMHRCFHNIFNTFNHYHNSFNDFYATPISNLNKKI